jgi:phosphoribosylformylglycinamidine cyclo-ligase
MASSGLHSNGYSLARHVLLGEPGQRAGLDLHTHIDDLGRTLGEELLEPTRIYSLQCLALMKTLGAQLHTFSHITGGGIAANIARVLPTELAADIDRSAWEVPAVFELISGIGGVAQAEMEKTFNMGLGMVAIVDASSASTAVNQLSNLGIVAKEIGSVRTRRDGETGDAAAKGGKGGAVTLH